MARGLGSLLCFQNSDDAILVEPDGFAAAAFHDFLRVSSRMGIDLDVGGAGHGCSSLSGRRRMQSARRRLAQGTSHAYGVTM